MTTSVAPEALALVAVEDGPAADLTRAIQEHAPDRFTIRALDDSPDRLLELEPETAIVLVQRDDETADAARLRARELRTRWYLWGPVWVLCRSHELPAADEELALQVASYPPALDQLLATMSDAPAVAPARRLECLRAGCKALFEDLSLLRRALDPSRLRNEQRRQILFVEVIEALRACDPEHAELRAYVERLQQMPVVERAELSQLAAMVVRGENEARERQDTQVAARLHQLNGLIRLSLGEPIDRDAIRARVHERVHALAVRPQAGKRTVIAPLQAACRAMAEHLASIDPPVDATQSALRECSSALRQFLDATAAPASIVRTPRFSRIVVVEDDEAWSHEIVELLRDLQLPEDIAIEQAASLEAANALLGGEPPALVIVDLGLPRRAGGPIELDAGLEVIRRASARAGSRAAPLHRFIVLTATENHEAAVRAALGLGLAPVYYLHKTPDVWLDDLGTRVQLLLRADPSPPPRLVVFTRTARIARLEDHELTLEYPHWCLLTVLARDPRRVATSLELATRLARHPFNLDPHDRGRPAEASSSSEPADGDGVDEADADAPLTGTEPEHRIAARLHDYAHGLRMRLDGAYRRIHGHAPPAALVEFDAEQRVYRLRARVATLDHVEPLAAPRIPWVLVVEDDERWGEEIVAELAIRGFRARRASTVAAAVAALETEPPELVSLDLELPLTAEDAASGRIAADGGLRVLRHIGGLSLDPHVAVLTGVASRTRLLIDVLGAGVRLDDVVSKHEPHASARLASSIERLWQERIARTRLLEWDVTATRHPIGIDPRTRAVLTIAGRPVAPGGRPGRILALLARTPNRFVSRTELIDALWGPDDSPENIDNALNQQIGELRRAITQSSGIAGDEVICGDRGVFWLQGNCVPVEHER